jgi:hypothetical protein
MLGEPAIASTISSAGEGSGAASQAPDSFPAGAQYEDGTPRLLARREVSNTPLLLLLALNGAMCFRATRPLLKAKPTNSR